MTYDFLIFIGRFQPFHWGHHAALTEALKLADDIIVLVGSSGGARSHRNPWTFEERKSMVLNAFPREDAERLWCYPLEDHLYNENAWLYQVQEIVEEATKGVHGARIGLMGYPKDHSSYYLRLFPQWEPVTVGNFKDLAATHAREAIFSNICDAWLKGSADFLPPRVVDFLRWWSGGPEYREVCREYEFIRGFREKWAESPYPPVFTTTDAVIVQACHVLLVRRGHHPGKGKLALPGGYLKIDMPLVDSMLSEVREETSIAVDDAALKRSIVGVPRVFDNPHRDPRGRFITHVYLMHLTPRRSDGYALPAVKGGDDADEALWVPLAEVRREEMFADHADIISAMVSVL